MNVLFISYFFPPDKSVGGFRASSMVKYFPEAGINVTLLTANTEISKSKKLLKEHNLKKVYHAKASQLRRIGYKTKILAVIELLKLDKWLFFPDIYFPWIRRANKLGGKIIENKKIDAIFVTAPPYSSFVVGYKLSKKYKLPLILDYRDPWTTNPTKNYPKFIVQKKHEKLERKIAKQGSIHVAVGNEAARLISISSGIPQTKFIIIPNGYFHENVKFANQVKEKNKFLISYFGNYYHVHKHIFEIFVKGVEKVILDNNLVPKDISLRYAGMTSRSAIKRDLNKGNLMPFFEDLGNLNGKELIQEIQKSHLNFVLVPAGVEYALATKIYDYALGDSHILIIGERGEVSKWCDEVEQKYTIIPESEKELQEGLNSLYLRWKQNKLEYGCNKSKLEEYDRKNLALKLANIIKERLA